MTNKPVKPSKQTTPPSQTNKTNMGNFGGGDPSTVVNVNQGLDLSAVSQILEELQSAIVDASSETAPGLEIELAPADRAIIPKVFSILPINFSFTVGPESAGKYGTVVTDTKTGQQSISVDVDITDADGIIDYEIRLIKND